MFACKWRAPGSVCVSRLLTLIRDADNEDRELDAGIEEDDPLLVEEDRAFLVAGFVRYPTPEIWDVELEEPRDYTSAVPGAGVRSHLSSAASGAGAEAASSSAAAAAEEPASDSGAVAAAAPEERRPRRGVKRCPVFYPPPPIARVQKPRKHRP